MWSAMSDESDPDKILARQARLVSIVIAVTMLGWMGAQWAGGRLGLPDRYVFLVDLFALAGFLWALIVTFQIWRKRRDN
jgi:membrane-associated PAP2 superfamily phosphatase